MRGSVIPVPVTVPNALLLLFSAVWLRPPLFANISADTYGQVIAYSAGRVIYNLYFHPLARFPGPLLWRSTRLAYVIRMNQGKLAFDVLDLYKRYGSVVRIAPNELAFSDANAWKDIYGHRVGTNHGAEEMDKFHTFYRTKGEVLSISSGDREYHARLRKQLAYGFSDRALREQETLIGGYITLLIKRLREHCEDRDRIDTVTGRPVKKEVDMKMWYNWTTFDVIGDLVFGEGFGSLEKAQDDPWVEAINGVRKVHVQSAR
jgi:hypothetical protein